MNEQNKKNKVRLCVGSILFGVILTICVFIIIHYESHIEFTRHHSSLIKDIILWSVEWVIILLNIAIPWIVWKKLVKPYL